ncbi:aspartate aminotransferase family protein [Aerococcus kribbianus]|uniref:Aspartate aminotransferase family protein n=1 Tax=Aerococcus kribbianus TaxID=2999064 RepID=A0A9X3JG59_9LACT|nr:MULTISPECIES: aspartate aminotransferase family protein [unclassified Aerococcus]MCZ0716901.1 aspartate aminotransferase family protein [Aerococcus sp. YH-aer221]MCZ0725189.1 aspartate aminotransferase family protein [Aerococcus sp. YH-aer222]
MSKSKEIIAKDKQYYATSGRIPYYPLVIDHAKGAQIIDADGKKYIDLLASASALNVGHAPDRVVAAIKEQTDKMIHYTPAYMYHQPVADLAEKLAEISPGNFTKKVAFGLSGSDANDAIIKFARAYTGRQNIVSFEQAYHGSTFGSLSMSAISLGMRQKIGPLLPGIYHIPYPDAYRGLYGETEPRSAEGYLQVFKSMTENYLPKEEIAAVVVETIQGDGGLLEPVPGYFRALADFCHANGILFAVDDVQQGLGRTGTWSSIEHFDVEADLIIYGKSLAGGLPLSAVVGRAEIMDGLQIPGHVFTTAANPVCCQAALATIQTIEEDNLLQASTDKGAYAKKAFTDLVNKYDFIGDVRGIGLSIGVDIVSDRQSKSKDSQAALKICNRAYEKGLLMIAVAGSVLRFQPPLVISYEELDQTFTILDEVFTELANGQLANYDVSGQGW